MKVGIGLSIYRSPNLICDNLQLESLMEFVTTAF
jgi:hypothetical protein